MAYRHCHFNGRGREVLGVLRAENRGGSPARADSASRAPLGRADPWKPLMRPSIEGISPSPSFHVYQKEGDENTGDIRRAETQAYRLKVATVYMIAVHQSIKLQ